MLGDTGWDLAPDFFPTVISRVTVIGLDNGGVGTSLKGIGSLSAVIAASRSTSFTEIPGNAGGGAGNVTVAVLISSSVPGTNKFSVTVRLPSAFSWSA
ncbi:MAG: hypothetical protein ACR2PI_25440 [Hyphomicrobiaceae bacterium]